MGGAQDNWLANLRALVDANSEGDDKRPGYRFVATGSGLSEEYVYQLYNRLPKADGSPRVVGPRAARSIARAFAHGRPPDWIDLPPAEAAFHGARWKTGDPLPPGASDIEINDESFGRVIDFLAELASKRDDRTRKALTSLIAAVLESPESAQLLKTALRAMLALDTATPSPPDIHADTIPGDLPDTAVVLGHSSTTTKPATRRSLKPKTKK